MAPPPLVDALNALFRERNEHGKARWKPEHIQAVRNWLLLDLCRRGEASKLNEANQRELAQLLAEIGLDENTPVDQVDPKVRAYFHRHPIPPAMADRIQKMFLERAQDRSALDAKHSFERWTGASDKMQKDPRDTGDGTNAQQFNLLRGVNIKI